VGRADVRRRFLDGSGPQAGYDRASDRWSPLPKSPLRGRAGHVAVWTGSHLLVWGGTPARASDPRKPFADGAAYTPYPL